MPYAPEHDELPNPLRVGLRTDSVPEPCALVVFGAIAFPPVRRQFA